MFELVQDYCPKEMDDYCSMIFFCNMQGLAKKYEKEITDIAVKRILKLVAEEKLADIQVKVQDDLLAENERYKELKQIESKINLNKGLKTTISTLISEMEKPLKTAQENHNSMIRQTNKALTAGYFVTNANEYDPKVLEFLNNDFKKYSDPESTM